MRGSVQRNSAAPPGQFLPEIVRYPRKQQAVSAIGYRCVAVQPHPANGLVYAVRRSVLVIPVTLVIPMTLVSRAGRAIRAVSLLGPSDN
ncbi:hypothetical protein [Paenibacillus borealis]|uniref:hypothetical protein n=1 Tax=Paenibacillus borealis TaxID=160799 RepID=UPI0012FDB9CA|nr:hypothetical protein [Paenibacillus borealis]